MGAEPSDDVPLYEFQQSGIQEWLLLGPVPRSERPEDPPRFFGEAREGESVELDSGKSFKWRRIRANASDGMVDLTAILEGHGGQDSKDPAEDKPEDDSEDNPEDNSEDDSVVYAFCHVRYPKPAKLQIAVGTSGLCRTWVEDQSAFVDPYRGTFTTNRHRFTVDFGEKRQQRLLLEMGRGLREFKFSCVGGYALRGRVQYGDGATPASLERITLHVDGHFQRSMTTDHAGRFVFHGVPYDSHVRLETEGSTVQIGGFKSVEMQDDREIGQYKPIYLRFTSSDAAELGIDRLELPFGSFTGIAERSDGRILLFDDATGSVLMWNGSDIEPHWDPRLSGFTSGNRGHLALDSQDAIWVITDQDGVYRFDGNEPAHWPASHMGQRFATFIVDQDDSLWVSFHDQPGCIFQLRPHENQPTKHVIKEMQNVTIATMTFTEEGLALFPTEGPMFLKAPDHSIHPLGQIEGAKFSHSTNLDDGSVIVAGSQLFEFGEKGDFISYWNPGDNNSRNQFIAAAPHGCRWAWSGSGIYFYQPDGLRLYKQMTYASNLNTEKKFQGFVSRTGALYRTFGADGVVRVFSTRVRRYDHRDGIQKITGNSVSSDGNMMVINSHDRHPLLIRDHAVTRFSGDNFGASTLPPSASRDVATISFGADGEAFLFDHLTDGSGDAIPTGCPPFQLVDDTWVPLTGVLSRGAACAYHFCLPGPDGETLIGTSDGLVSVRESHSEFSDYFHGDPDGKDRRPINNVWVSPDGAIWATEERGPLLCRQGEQLKRFEFEAAEPPWATRIEQFNGVMYVSTLDGLFYLDPAVKRLRRSKDARFAHTPVAGIGVYQTPPTVGQELPEEHGTHLCIATRRNGVHAMDTDGNVVRLREFDALDDLMVTNLYLDSRHRIWLSSERGTYCYSPSSIPPVLIVEKVNDAQGEIDIDSDPELPIGQSVKFHMSGRDDAAVLQFQYRINDGEWLVFSDGSQTAMLDYLLSEKGSQQIGFRCIDSDLNISNPVFIRFRVIVPLWQTPAFRFGLMGVFVVLCVTIAQLLIAARKSRIDRAELREALLREANEARVIAEQATNEREMLLARVCHDLRNPLTVVRGSVDMLQLPGPDVDTVVSVLSDSSESMTHLTEQLLMYAKSRRSDVSQSAVVVNVEEMLDGLTSLYGLRVYDGKVDFETEMAENCPQEIRVDQAIMLEIIKNLVDNAIRHTTNGMVKVRCRMAEDSAFTVDVIDTGEGIPPEMAETIFDPFHSGSSGTFRSKRGSQGRAGLGLYISKQLIEHLGGTVELSSEVHKGTMVTVCFGDVSLQSPEGVRAG